ncbi:hypothetical protein GCM10009641_44360 [Mycobacterium cookii]
MALALAIPLLLAAVLGGLRVTSDYSDSRQAASSARQVTVIQPAIDYLTAAEAAMVAAQTDSAASQGDLIDSISDIASSAETLVQARESADLDERQAAHVDALLDLSQAMRGVGAENLGPATWIALVRQLESSVSQLITSVNAAQETPEPRLEQISQAMSGRLSLALQQGLLATSLSQSSSQELFSEIGVEAAAIDRLAGSVEGADDQTALLRTQNTRHAGQIRDDSATNLDGRDAYVPYDEITQTLVTGVTDTLDQAASDAQRNALVGAVLTLLALAAAVFLALFVARSLLEPIGKVREGALAVARHRLPDAVARIRAGQQPEPIRTIEVTTNEEIGQVARAVDDLHRQAIHLASGEAQLRQTVNAMFVTLSRRSTSLVNQQLAQIERLEHDEEDPKRLESLFRLDHLASRMRRTADSLLILADAPNRAAGQFSLTVGEALQAATSGVQDYQRVQILSHLSTRVGDEAAADVVHLLTELVDNALSFSPPAEPVRLAAKLGEDGVTVTITDSGLGVPPAELEQLNGDLRHGAEATPDTARRMGLFVVSRLAERHSITVSLARNPGGGMTASVVLPTSVLPDLPQTSAPAAAPAVAAAASAAPVAETLDTSDVAARTESRREARNRARVEKAQAKAAGKAADKAAAKVTEEPTQPAAAAPVAAPAAPAATPEPAPAPVAAPAGAAPAPSPDRPSLESLLPRREPGANIPRTGADAFLPPETSGATGPLFGKRAEPAADAAPAPAAAPDAGAGAAEKVASVVPITALASRQRAQAVEEARTAEPAPAPEPAAPPAAPPAAESPAEPAASTEEPARAADPLSDPLTDPLPDDAFDGPQPAADVEPEPEPEVEAEPEPEQTAVAATRRPDVEVDVDDPLGLGSSQPEAVPVPAAVEPEPAPEPEPEPVVEPQPVVARVDPEPVPVAEEAPAPTREPAAAAYGADVLGSAYAPAPLATTGRAANGNGQNGHAANGTGTGHGTGNGNGATVRAGSDSPIFKSMRSGWLASEGEGEFHHTEIDRGWEIAEKAAEEVPVVESTVTGLPRRAPGERLVPGSVTPPTAAKTRDPEAIRRRLQAHTAGVSRGRRAAQSPPQHTEAGPA